MGRFTLLLLSLAIVAVCSHAQEYKMEQECARVGGMCLPAEDCPEGLMAEKGLCPSQQNAGVECCHGLSNKETRCSARGGICTTKCPSALLINQATDCPTGNICCTLV